LGNRVPNAANPVGRGIAAVIATIRRSCLANLTSVFTAIAV